VVGGFATNRPRSSTTHHRRTHSSREAQRHRSRTTQEDHPDGEGHKGQRHRLFHRANESVTHALAYAYRDRRDKKGQFRRLWIVRTSTLPASRPQLQPPDRRSGKAGVALDRKVLADIAVRDDGPSAGSWSRRAATA
jgi:large subunit ribosomal protein L20